MELSRHGASYFTKFLSLSFEDFQTASATLETGTSFEMKRHGSLPEINSRFSWFRRKSKNGTRMPRSFVRGNLRGFFQVLSPF